MSSKVSSRGGGAPAAGSSLLVRIQVDSHGWHNRAKEELRSEIWCDVKCEELSSLGKLGKLLYERVAEVAPRSRSALPKPQDMVVCDQDGTAIEAVQLSKLQHMCAPSHSAHLRNQVDIILRVSEAVARGEKMMPMTFQQQLQINSSLITKPTASGDRDQVACLYYMSEFVDNSIRAYMDVPVTRERIIDVYMFNEKVRGALEFSCMVFVDVGCGMTKAAVDRWLKRGNKPHRTHPRTAFSRLWKLIKYELQQPFFLDPDMSVFGIGSTRAAFQLGVSVGVVTKAAGHDVVQAAIVKSKVDDQYDAKLAVSTRPLFDLSEHGTYEDAECWRGSSIRNDIEGAALSKELPRLLQYIETCGSSERHRRGPEDASKHSFTAFIVTGLRGGSKDEDVKAEVFRNFNRVCNTLRTMYFFHLGFGPFCGRYFGGDLPSSSQRVDEALPWGARIRSCQPKDLRGKDMNLRMHVFCLRSSCAPSRFDPDVDSAMRGVNPQLVHHLGSEVTRSSGTEEPRYRHRCLNEMPYEGWPLQPPQSAAEVAGEDAMSRMARLCTQRVRELVSSLEEQRQTSSGRVARERVERDIRDLEDLRTFTVAVTNKHWADGKLPLQMSLHYLERHGEEQRLHQLILPDKHSRLSQLDETHARCTMPLLGRQEADRFVIWWSGRLSGMTKIPSEPHKVAFAFMAIPDSDKSVLRILKMFFWRTVLSIAPKVKANEKDDKLIRQLNNAIAEAAHLCIAGHMFQCDWKPRERQLEEPQSLEPAVESASDNDTDDGILPPEVKAPRAGTARTAAHVYTRDVVPESAEDRSAQVSELKHTAGENLVKNFLPSSSTFLRYYQAPGKQYIQPRYATVAHLDKTGNPSKTGMAKDYERELQKLVPEQVVRLDFAVWLGRCISTLDDTFELTDPLPSKPPVEISTTTKAYRCCSIAHGRALEPGDFVAIDVRQGRDATPAMRVTDALGSRPLSRIWGVVACFLEEAGQGTRKGSKKVVFKRILTAEDAEVEQNRDNWLVAPLRLCVPEPRKHGFGLPAGLRRYLSPGKESLGPADYAPRTLIVALSGTKQSPLRPLPSGVTSSWQQTSLPGILLIMLAGRRDAPCVPVTKFAARVPLERAGYDIKKLMNSDLPGATGFKIAVSLLQGKHVVSVTDVVTTREHPHTSGFYPVHQAGPVSEVLLKQGYTLAPGSYALSISVWHELLSGSAADADACYRFDSVQVCGALSTKTGGKTLYQLVELASPSEVATGGRPCSAHIPFTVAAGAPDHLRCVGLLHGEGPYYLGGYTGGRRINYEPRLLCIFLAVHDSVGMQRSDVASAEVAEFVNDQLESLQKRITLAWPASSVEKREGRPLPCTIRLQATSAVPLRVNEGEAHFELAAYILPARVHSSSGELDMADHARGMLEGLWGRSDTRGKPKPLQLDVKIDSEAHSDRCKLFVLPGHAHSVRIEGLRPEVPNGGHLARPGVLRITLLDPFGFPATLCHPDFNHNSRNPWAVLDSNPFVAPLLRARASVPGEAAPKDVFRISVDALADYCEWELHESAFVLRPDQSLLRLKLTPEEWRTAGGQIEAQLECKLYEVTRRKQDARGVAVPNQVQELQEQAAGIADRLSGPRHMEPAPFAIVARPGPVLADLLPGDKDVEVLPGAPHARADVEWSVVGACGQALPDLLLRLSREDGSRVKGRLHVTCSHAPRAGAGQEDLTPSRPVLRPDGLVALAGCRVPAIVGGPVHEYEYEVRHGGLLCLTVAVVVTPRPGDPHRWGVRFTDSSGATETRARCSGSGTMVAVSQLDAAGNVLEADIPDDVLPDLELSLVSGGSAFKATVGLAPALTHYNAEELVEVVDGALASIIISMSAHKPDLLCAPPHLRLRPEALFAPVAGGCIH